MRARVGAVFNPEAGQQLERSFASLRSWQRVADVAPRAQVREQRVVLEHQPAAAALGREVDAARDVEPRLAIALDAAGLGMQQPGQRTQSARLAGARRARQCDALAGFDLELQLEPRLGPLELSAEHRPASPLQGPLPTRTRERRTARARR